MLRGLILFVTTLPAYGAIQVTGIVPIPADSGQKTLGVKTDSAGNLISAGIIAPFAAISSTPPPDVFVRKTDASGDSVFERRFPGGSANLAGFPLAVHASGDIYVAGVASEADAFPFTSVLLASATPSFVINLHGKDGTIAWSAQIDGRPGAIALDANGDVVVAVDEFTPALLTTPDTYDSGPAGSPDVATSIIRISAADLPLLLLIPPSTLKSAPPMAPVCTREQLVSLRRQWRREGRTVVFTNGCFDILHPGHIALLEQARSLGDALILAVNSDASVRRMKGPARPLVPEQDRTEVAAALAAVDAVVLFDEDTPRELIAAVLPDVLVKGADWSHFIAGREEVEAAGGRVVALPLEPGFSTTSIVERILATQ